MRDHDSRRPLAPRVLPSGRNVAEVAFEDLARSAGWTPTKQGWPDFICTGPMGEMIAVEVKPRTGRGRLVYLKVAQARCLDWLAAHGIRCFVSDGYELERYDRRRHARPAPHSRIIGG